MYLQEISLQNLRVFADAKAAFQYPGRVGGPEERALEHPNLNLILGNNGAGKSSLLKAIALAGLGPMADKFAPYLLVRRVHGAKKKKPLATPSGPWPGETAAITSRFKLTWQDMGLKKPSGESKTLPWHVHIEPRGEEEFVRLEWNNWDAEGAAPGAPIWEPLYRQGSPAFLAVGYGATRRVDTDPNGATPAQRLRTLPLRHQRIQSLFTEGYTLVPLGHWLPQLKTSNPGRFKQVCGRINELLPVGIEFTTRTDASGEYLFAQGGTFIPFAALSDGSRAFIGWVADLLYHICFGCPSGVKLVDNCGLVLVDEIDLHLHPEWQRLVLPRLAKTFPKLQFIVTSHSPIVVGTLQRENIWVCEPSPDGNSSILAQKEIGVNGLNADQILLTSYFGLATSRAAAKERQLDKIAAAAERKTPGQAAAFLRSLVTPMEDDRD